MTVPEHNALRALTGGSFNVFTDSNTTDLLTSSMTSLVMACTETPEKINIEKNNKKLRLNFSIFSFKNLLKANPLQAIPLVALVSLISRNYLVD